MFRAGRPSRFPDWGGKEAELPSDKLPLLISFSHGDLDTTKTEQKAIKPSKIEHHEALGEVIRETTVLRAGGSGKVISPWSVPGQPLAECIRPIKRPKREEGKWKGTQEVCGSGCHLEGDRGTAKTGMGRPS